LIATRVNELKDVLWKTRPSGLLTAKPGTKKRAEEFYAAFSQVLFM